MKRKTMTPRIVLCESDDCSPRGEVRQPHELTMDCKHPVTVQAPVEKQDER